MEKSLNVSLPLVSNWEIREKSGSCWKQMESTSGLSRGSKISIKKPFYDSPWFGALWLLTFVRHPRQRTNRMLLGHRHVIRWPLSPFSQLDPDPLPSPSCSGPLFLILLGGSRSQGRKPVHGPSWAGWWETPALFTLSYSTSWQVWCCAWCICSYSPSSSGRRFTNLILQREELSFPEAR